jgi:uncharacterized membrane protein YkoI
MHQEVFMVIGKKNARMGTILLIFIISLFVLTGCESKIKGSIPVSDKKIADFPDMAKISMMDALNKAQAKVPGKAVEVELKKEDGYLIYEVEIVRPDRTVMELEVDAGNGAILRTEKEKA